MTDHKKDFTCTDCGKTQKEFLYSMTKVASRPRCESCGGPLYRQRFRKRKRTKRQRTVWDRHRGKMAQETDKPKLTFAEIKARNAARA